MYIASDTSLTGQVHDAMADILRHCPKLPACKMLTVPVTLHGLGVEGGHNVQVFTQAVKQVAGQVHLVPNLQWPYRANLELPLPWHHLSIDA